MNRYVSELTTRSSYFNEFVHAIALQVYFRMKYKRLLTSETTSIPLQKENVFMMLHPYKIEIADLVLDDLRERLTRTRLPENDDRGWEDGIDLTYLQELITYWRDQFDWKAQEEKLNRFNQLRGSVDGTTVHVIHEQGNGPAPLPIRSRPRVARQPFPLQ